MKTHLKIKLMTLAEESRIIRCETKRWGKARCFAPSNPAHPEGPFKPVTHPMVHSLYMHRIVAVRKEARAASLAYGFLRGRDYLKMEARCYYPPDWERVEYHVKTFGNGFVKGKPIDVERDVMQRFQGWLAVAKTEADKNICIARRVTQQLTGFKRRQNYKACYWRPIPADQSQLKASLKAKWEART
jgi:hypothetical protein